MRVLACVRVRVLSVCCILCAFRLRGRELYLLRSFPFLIYCSVCSSLYSRKLYHHTLELGWYWSCLWTLWRTRDTGGATGSAYAHTPDTSHTEDTCAIEYNYAKNYTDDPASHRCTIVSATTDSAPPFPLMTTSRAAAHGTRADCMQQRKCSAYTISSFLFLFLMNSPLRSFPRERRIFQGISSSSVCFRSLARSLARIRRANVVLIDVAHYLTQIASCCVIIFYRLIDCLYLCFSLPARYTWLYCYTLICVPHVLWRRFISYSDRFSFSFLLQRCTESADFSFFLPFESVSWAEERHPSRIQIWILSLPFSLLLGNARCPMRIIILNA